MLNVSTRKLLWAAAWVVLGCNTQAPAASAPSSASPQPSAAQTTSSEAPVDARADDSAILQAFIDAPALQGYYHVDKLPERKPLVLLEGPHTKGAALEKFGVPVEIVPAERVGARPHLAIGALERNGEKAVVRFRYDVEGLGGEVRLSRHDGAWRVDGQDIAER
jgi:hypothetical protein